MGIVGFRRYQSRIQWTREEGEEKEAVGTSMVPATRDFEVKDQVLYPPHSAGRDLPGFRVTSEMPVVQNGRSPMTFPSRNR